MTGLCDCGGPMIEDGCLSDPNVPGDGLCHATAAEVCSTCGHRLGLHGDPYPECSVPGCRCDMPTMSVSLVLEAVADTGDDS